jgi:cell surface protein SprA
VTETYNQEDILGTPPTPTLNGTNRGSVWAFGASYLSLVESQLQTFRDDFEAAPPGSSVIGDANGDGRVVLTNESVVEDFRSSFLTTTATVKGLGAPPFPMPNWNINYSGLGSWPLLRKLVQSATLRHGYASDYSDDFRTNSISLAAGGDTTLVFPLIPGISIEYPVPGIETGAVRINERFQPMVGVDLTWKGNLSTNIAWNKTTSFSLGTSNFDVSQSKTNELTLSLNYQKSGMTIPFLGSKLNNRVSLSLSMSRAITRDERFLLKKTVTEAIADPDNFELPDALGGDFVSVITAHERLTLAPQISYQFSNRVTANFTLRYEKFSSEDSRRPSSTTMAGTFNIRVNIAN